MKIDRMLEMIIYLLNHDHVSASFLAERFHVSVRTIQRDIVNISAIGIPVYADGGRNGGYSILSSYKLQNSDIRKEEQQLIIKALESLSTTYSSDSLDALIEKYNAIVEKEGRQKVFWDFSVTKENQSVQEMNVQLQKAIDARQYISFNYRNANGEKSKQKVEPLAIHYKWYAWYLFAYDEQKQKYKTFKVARMQHIVLEQKKSNIEHGDIELRMKESEQAYYKTCIQIEVHFHKAEAELMSEYFPDCPIERLDQNLCKMIIEVPAKERLWKAYLLSFGDKVKIISPVDYKQELITTAQKFLSNYDI